MLVAGVGTAVWAVASVVLALLHAALARHHELWWLWTALAGTGLGLIGTGLQLRRQRRRTAG